MCLFIPVSAEYVHLTDGLIIKGKIIQITEKGIVIETAQGKRKNIKKNKIIKITKKLPVNISRSKNRKSKTKRKIESWYHSLSFGYPVISGVNTGDGNIKKTFALTMDYLRFYWRIGHNKKLLAGIGLWGTSFTKEESWYESFNDLGTVQLSLSFFSASAQYYFNEIGNGFFVRADLGTVAGSVLHDLKVQSSSSLGFGFSAGIGYGIPISHETSLLFQLNYIYYGITPRFYTINLTLGWLW